MKHLVEILLIFAVLSTSINMYLYKSIKDADGVISANQHLNKENAELQVELSNLNALVKSNQKEIDSFTKEINKKDSLIVELDSKITDLATMVLRRVEVKTKKSLTKFDNLWQNSNENSIQSNH